jgi:hypothetical protein
MFEPSRKHGAFDLRHPVSVKLALPAYVGTGQQLDAQQFYAQYFAGARRHDFAALAAYQAHRAHWDGEEAAD